jgi:hypothetical protein
MVRRPRLHFVLSLVGKPITECQAEYDSVADDHIAWHADQVFTAVARKFAWVISPTHVASHPAPRTRHPPRTICALAVRRP